LLETRGVLFYEKNAGAGEQTLRIPLVHLWPYPSKNMVS